MWVPLQELGFCKIFVPHKLEYAIPIRALYRLIHDCSPLNLQEVEKHKYICNVIEMLD